MRVSCRTSFSHATLSGIDSGHVFVPRANYCRLIFELGCISDLSHKGVIQSHLVNPPESKSGAQEGPPPRDLLPEPRVVLGFVLDQNDL
jgi:hypothetical protein